MNRFKIEDARSQLFAVRAVQILPLNKTWLVEIKPFVKKRSSGQNRYQWSALLSDYVEQGFFEGKQFNQEVWHEYLKKKFLPEYFDEELTLEGYKKWIELPDGSLKMVGSTTKLTTKGFGEYIEKCYAFGSQELGIRFSANV